MRSVWFAVFDARLEDVENSLAEAGCVRRVRDDWDYPGLYLRVSVHDSTSLDTQEEAEELRRVIGDRIPTVWVHADVSGRVDGDTEVRHLAEAVMSRFHAFAFDDYTAYWHAWTLDEIRTNARFEGLHYFDYRGYHERWKKLN